VVVSPPSAFHMSVNAARTSIVMRPRSRPSHVSAQARGGVASFRSKAIPRLFAVQLREKCSDFDSLYYDLVPKSDPVKLGCMRVDRTA